MEKEINWCLLLPQEKFIFFAARTNQGEFQMTFKQLVRLHGGMVPMAKILKVNHATVYKWYHRLHTPQARFAHKIIKLSKHQITYTDLLKRA